MQTAIGIFAKTPGLSPIKTRLAREIGEAAALEFYQLSLKATEALVQHACAEDPRLVPHWALAETGAPSDFWNRFSSIQSTLHQTPEGRDTAGLGERLAHVYEQLQSRYGSVILMGTDSPLLSPLELIQAAVRVRSEPGFAIAPAADGGFVLFAGSLPLPRKAWLQVTYSAEQTSRELEASVQKWAGKSCSRLQGAVDVDTLEDLSRLVHRHANSIGGKLLTEQAELIHWGVKFLSGAPLKGSLY